MKWADKKKCIADALKKDGYSDEKQKDILQMIDENNPMIPTVNLKLQPKEGMNIPVYFINTEDLEGEYLQDVNGQLGAAKQIIRQAINGLEAEQPKQKESKIESKIYINKEDQKQAIKPIKESNNVPTPQPTRPTQAMIAGGPAKLSIDIIQQYINPDLTQEQAYNFMQLCVASDLNPFRGEVHAIIFKGKASFVVGVGGNMRRAQEQLDYNGYEAGIIVMKEDGTIEDRIGTFMINTDKVLGGFCKIWRKNIDHPFITRISYDEYVQMKDGHPNAIWAKKPATMCAKVAISQGHRNAYMGINSGLYGQEEITDLGDVEVIE